jgi:hypothetical protein
LAILRFLFLKKNFAGRAGSRWSAGGVANTERISLPRPGKIVEKSVAIPDQACITPV